MATFNKEEAKAFLNLMEFCPSVSELNNGANAVEKVKRFDLLHQMMSDARHALSTVETNKP